MGLFSSSSPGYTRSTSIVRYGSRTGALTVGATAVPLRVGNTTLEDRHTLVVSNVSANTVYIGFSDGVTTANGLPIPANVERVFELAKGVEVYAVAPSASELRIAEVM